MAINHRLSVPVYMTDAAWLSLLATLLITFSFFVLLLLLLLCRWAPDDADLFLLSCVLSREKGLLVLAEVEVEVEDGLSMALPAVEAGTPTRDSGPLGNCPRTCFAPCGGRSIFTFYCNNYSAEYPNYSYVARFTLTMVPSWRSQTIGMWCSAMTVYYSTRRFFRSRASLT